MKKCQICGKPASVFLTQIANGKLKDVALCKECARENGFFDPRRLVLAGQFLPKELSGQVEELIRHLLNGDEIEDGSPDNDGGDETEKTERRRKRRGGICPNCGYTWAKFRETHQLGCPKCYEQFEERLHRVFPPPDWNEEEADETVEVNEQKMKEHLRKSLEQAVKKENYEEAARLRDCIRELDKS